MILTDALVDRVHAVQKESLRVFAEAYARFRADSVNSAIGTGFAIYAGEGSPLTQCLGFAHRSFGDPEEIEAFYTPRTPNWEVTLTPFTNGDTVRAFFSNGYHFTSFEGVLGQWVAGVPEVAHEVVEIEGDLELWLETSTRAWEGKEEGAVDPPEFARASSLAPARHYLAIYDGVPAAAASMIEVGDAVLLVGGATRVPYRGLGLQTALIARRLRDAGAGRLALIGALPGTTSHRNAQRAGFAPLYSTVTLMRRPPAAAE